MRLILPFVKNNNYLDKKFHRFGINHNQLSSTGGCRFGNCCSYSLAISINSHSLPGSPKSSKPTGTPMGAWSVGAEKPAGKQTDG
jgi:hypothetical protein